MFSRAARRLAAVPFFLAAVGLFGAVPASADDSPYDDAVKPAVLRQSKDGDKPADDMVKKPSHAKKRRGGLNPCMTPDPGFGIYDGWSGGLTVGHALLPHRGGVTKSGSFDLIVHFHGHEPIRKEFVKTAKGVVLVGIDLGIGSGAYSQHFSSPHVFTDLLASVEAAVAKHAGIPHAKVRKLALSSWSAGYGATEQILRQPVAKRVDSVILLDSLHAGYIDEGAKSLKEEQLTPFVAFAKRAAQKQTFMFLSHSSIIPPGYASTTEVADYIAHRLGGRLKKASRKDVLGLDMIDRFDKGSVHVRGYTGDDKPDHCAHIGLMADVVRSHLEPRWKTPRGRK